MREYLDFEKPLRDLDERIAKFAKSGSKKNSVQEAIRRITERRSRLELEIYGNLSSWQRTQMARHPQRPSMLDYLGMICQDFIELHGDRLFGDDQALVGGFATSSG